MKNECHKVKIIEEKNNQITIVFLDSGIEMPLSKKLFNTKVENGFYKVVPE